MPNVTITGLPTAGPILGTESVPIVQNGQTVQTTTAAIAASPSQFQTFLTINQEPTLPNSRYFSTGTGLGIVDNGAQSYFRLDLNGASGSLETALTGIIAKDSASTVVGRTITAGSSGVSITNGNGVAGNPIIALTGTVGALASLASTGMLSVGGGSVNARVLTGTASQIDVANGNGTGNPTFSIAANPTIPGSGAMIIPSGTTAQRPVGTDGMIRFNTDDSAFEVYESGSWSSLPGGAITLINTGTGLTGGPITTTGTISIANTGVVAATYGSSSTVPQIAVNAQGQITSASDITITPSGIGAVASVSGTANEITATGTTNVILSLPSSLTFTGKTVTGGTFNMDAATISSSNVVTETAIQTLTNKTISGLNNTLSNIANASLDNSSVTYNGVTVSLGGSATITAVTVNPLTIGTGLSGTSFNGSAPITIAIDSSVVTLDGMQTLTNKSISGSANTLTNIGNSSLTNSSVTVNGTAISLGGSGTITASTTSTLTIGTGLSGTSFNGGSPVTIAIDSSVVTLNGIQTLTNKSISGTDNTLTNIPNSALSNSSVTIGSTSVSLGGTTTTLAGLTSVTLTQNPSLALEAATKQYVDALYTSGIHYHQAVKYEVPDTTGSLNALYNQPGGPGVGVNATLTNNGTLVAFAPDGPTASVGDRILIYNQTNAYENGVYVVSVVGDGTTAWVLTRATDADTYNPTSPNGLGQGDAFFVTSGNTGAGETYECNTVGTITFGTTAITFVQISSAQVYSAGTGLTLLNTTFSITNTGVSASTYGSASSVPVIAVNAQGQITSATNTSIAINGNQITSGTVGSSYISGSYTGVTGVGVLTAGTWNADAVQPLYGGTGITSYSTGDLLYASGTTALSRLALGTSTYVLTAGASAPQYVAQSTLSVGSATTATNVSGGATGSLVYQSAASTTTTLPLGATDYVLTAGASAPQYVAQSTLSVGSATTATTATNVAGGATGSLVYQSGASATTTLALGTTSYVLTAGASAPQYVAQSTLAVGSATTATNVSGGSAGSLVYQSGASTTTTLALGTTNYVLTAGASAPQYVAQSTLSVGSATDATNTGITLSSANANYYLTVVSASTGNLPQLVATGLTANPSTGKITSGIAGGTF